MNNMDFLQLKQKAARQNFDLVNVREGRPFNPKQLSQLLDKKRNFRMVSLNILAPELLMYFWRSSYGLPVIPSRRDQSHFQHYDQINRDRIDKIIQLLASYRADILCLQEVTSSTYDYLDGLTIQEYIATRLNYRVVGESFKNSIFNYNYPPNEQIFLRNAEDRLGMDSGVATLVHRDSRLKEITHVMSAEDFEPSVLFKSPTASGSPMTIEKLVFPSNEVIYLVNLHVRMLYPSIKLPVEEIYQRLQQSLGKKNLQRTILLGDFNSHSLLTAIELLKSNLNTQMRDLNGADLIDDHVWVGRQLYRNYIISSKNDTRLELLEMNVNDPTSDPKKYKQLDIEYNQSPINQQLLDTRKMTTDHYPIILNIAI